MKHCARWCSRARAEALRRMASKERDNKSGSETLPEGRSFDLGERAKALMQSQGGLGADHRYRAQKRNRYAPNTFTHAAPVVTDPRDATP